MNLPEPFLKRMKQTLGEDFDAFLKSYEEGRYQGLRVNELKISRDDFLKLSGFSLEQVPWCGNGFYYKEEERPGRHVWHEAGMYYIQEPSAMSAAELLQAKPGERVLDLCAAPGGKSFAAAIDMHNKGSILSCDLHEKKLGLIQNGAKRLGIEIISTKAQDARCEVNEKFDFIIADVPCSGYGVIRKKPDIRFKPENERLLLPAIQSAILDNLSHALKPGGILIYSTCTVFTEENEDVVNKFLESHIDFEAVSYTLPNGKTVESGMYTFWPHIDGTDGFFVCKLRRKK